MYLCTSKASKLRGRRQRQLRCQYLYFCTSNASKMNTCPLARNQGARYASNAALVSERLCVSICTFVLVKQANWERGRRQGRAALLVMRQYVYCCTSSKASKLRQPESEVSVKGSAVKQVKQVKQVTQRWSTERQSLYCCTSKASKLSTQVGLKGSAVKQVKQVNRLPVDSGDKHAERAVSIRQHTSAYVSRLPVASGD